MTGCTAFVTKAGLKGQVLGAEEGVIVGEACANNIAKMTAKIIATVFGS